MRYANVYKSYEGYAINGVTDDGKQVAVTITDELQTAAQTIATAVDAQIDHDMQEVQRAAVQAQEEADIANNRANTIEIKLTNLVALLPAYKVGTAYKVGDLCVYEGTPYKIIQAHTSQADWVPANTPALYKVATSGDDPSIPVAEWVQPTGAHDAYNTGDRCTYEGKTLESTVDGNAYAPGVVDGQWVVVES